MTAVPATLLVASGANFAGRVELSCREGPQFLSTSEPALGVLLDADGAIVGEFGGMMSGWGRELALNPGDTGFLDFVAAAVTPGSVDGTPVATLPGEYDLVVAVSHVRWPAGDQPAQVGYIWTTPVRVHVVER